MIENSFFIGSFWLSFISVYWIDQKGRNEGLWNVRKVEQQSESIVLKLLERAGWEKPVDLNIVLKNYMNR